MGDIKLSLIDFDGLSGVAKLLIKKVSNAIGWIANKESYKQIAESTYIEEIKKSDYDPLTKAAFISSTRKTIKEYLRQCDIVKIAIDNIREDAKPDELDDDWLLQFLDKARLVSDAEFQFIWGKLLAEECNEPGSIPRSLLHTLERMDRKDAEQFAKICSFAVWDYEEGIPEYSLIIVKNRFDDYYTSQKGINYSSIVDLASLGLIESNLGPLSNGYQRNYSSLPITIHYYDELISFQEKTKALPIGNVILTKTGQALCKAIKAEKQDDFWQEICLPLWDQRKLDELNAEA